MRVLLQRVSRAEVRVGARVTGRIGRGYLLLVGLTHADDEPSSSPGWPTRSSGSASSPTPTTR